MVHQEFPGSERNVSVVGRSSQGQRVPLSEPLMVTLSPSSENSAFLLGDTAPANFLGRDLLSKLGDVQLASQNRTPRSGL